MKSFKTFNWVLVNGLLLALIPLHFSHSKTDSGEYELGDIDQLAVRVEKESKELNDLKSKQKKNIEDERKIKIQIQADRVIGNTLLNKGSQIKINADFSFDKNEETLIPIPDDSAIDKDKLKQDVISLFLTRTPSDDDKTFKSKDYSEIMDVYDRVQEELKRRITDLEDRAAQEPSESKNKLLQFVDFLKSEKLRDANSLKIDDEDEGGVIEDWIKFSSSRGEFTIDRTDDARAFKALNLSLGSGQMGKMNYLRLIYLDRYLRDYKEAMETELERKRSTGGTKLAEVADVLQWKADLKRIKEEKSSIPEEIKRREPNLKELRLTLNRLRRQGEDRDRKDLLGMLGGSSSSPLSLSDKREFLSIESLKSILNGMDRTSCRKSNAIPLSFLSKFMESPLGFKVQMSTDSSKLNISLENFARSSCLNPDSLQFKARRTQNGNVFISAHLVGRNGSMFSLLKCLLLRDKLDVDTVEQKTYFAKGYGGVQYFDNILIEDEVSSPRTAGNIYFESGVLTLPELSSPAISSDEKRFKTVVGSKECLRVEDLAPYTLTYSSVENRKRLELARKAEKACKDNDLKALISQYKELKNLGNAGSMLEILRELMGKLIESELSALNADLKVAKTEEDMGTASAKRYGELLSLLDQFVVQPLIEDYKKIARRRGGNRDQIRARRERLKEMARSIRRYGGRDFVSKRAVASLEGIGRFGLASKASALHNKIKVYGSANVTATLARKNKEVRRLNKIYEARISLKEAKYEASHGYATYSGEYRGKRQRLQYFQDRSWRNYLASRNKGRSYCQTNPWTGRPNNLSACQRWMRNYQTDYQRALGQRQRYSQGIQLYGGLEQQFLGYEAIGRRRIAAEAGYDGFDSSDPFSLLQDPELLAEFNISPLGNSFSLQNPNAQMFDVNQMAFNPNGTQFNGGSPYSQNGPFQVNGGRLPSNSYTSGFNPNGAFNINPTFGGNSIPTQNFMPASGNQFQQVNNPGYFFNPNGNFMNP